MNKTPALEVRPMTDAQAGKPVMTCDVAQIGRFSVLWKHLPTYNPITWALLSPPPRLQVRTLGLRGSFYLLVTELMSDRAGI